MINRNERFNRVIKDCDKLKRSRELNPNIDNSDFLLKICEELPVSVDKYVFFLKNRHFFYCLYAFNGYLLRDTCLLLLKQHGIPLSTASAILSKFIEMKFLGTKEFGNYNIIYIKDRAVNSIVYYYGVNFYKVNPARICNAGLTKNTLIALYYLELVESKIKVLAIYSTDDFFVFGIKDKNIS